MRFGIVILGVALVPAVATPSAGQASREARPSPEIARAIDSVEARFERALAERDRPTLEQLVAEPFTWVHASDGRTDSREPWLRAAAQGMALSGQRSVRTEHGSVMTSYGEPQPQTVIRVARVQIVDTARARETWMRQSQTFVRGADGKYRVAAGQGTLMYEGRRLDPALHARYQGTYDLPDGRTLVLRWEDGALMATFPNRSTAQIFLASPTEEVVRTTGLDRLRFTLDANQRPVAAALVRGETEVWRAPRRTP